MTINERMSRLCIKISDWISHPIALVAFPVICIGYLLMGGKENSLTLILSVIAISLTQMVLNAQNVDMQQTKLQISELVLANPEARNKVNKKDMTKDELQSLDKEIQDATTTT